MKGGLTTEVPSGAKLAMEIEVEGPFWRVQSQPAEGSTTQPQVVVRTYKSSPRAARSQDSSRKTRKLDFDLIAHLLKKVSNTPKTLPEHYFEDFSETGTL